LTGRKTRRVLASEASNWIKFDLDIDLKSAVLIADEVQGNVVTSRDHIPGTMLLPIMAGVLCDMDIAPQDIRDGFACGDIRVLPAYPVVDDQRALPAPFVWGQEKDGSGGPDGEGEITNSLIDDGADYTKRREPIRGGFVVLGEKSTPHIMRPQKIVRTHTPSTTTGRSRRRQPAAASTPMRCSSPANASDPSFGSERPLSASRNSRRKPQMYRLR
jgi:hypothetical protein